MSLTITDRVIALKSLETFTKVADGRATKIIIPSEIQSMAGLATSLKELVVDGEMDKSPKPNQSASATVGTAPGIPSVSDTVNAKEALRAQAKQNIQNIPRPQNNMQQPQQKSPFDYS